MTPVVSKSRSRKVNGYVKAVVALEAVRRKREERYERVVRPRATAARIGGDAIGLDHDHAAQ